MFVVIHYCIVLFIVESHILCVCVVEFHTLLLLLQGPLGIMLATTVTLVALAEARIGDVLVGHNDKEDKEEMEGRMRSCPLVDTTNAEPCARNAIHAHACPAHRSCACAQGSACKTQGWRVL